MESELIFDSPSFLKILNKSKVYNLNNNCYYFHKMFEIFDSVFKSSKKMAKLSGSKRLTYCCFEQNVIPK